MSTETLISEVVITLMFTPSLASAWNMRCATPAWLRMPIPTIETFATSSSVSIAEKSSPPEARAESIAAIEATKASGGIDFAGLDVDEEVAKVSIVGIGMRSQAGVAHRMFEALARDGVNIKVITTSEIKVSVLIDRKYLELAVQALHDAFELDKTS